MDHDRPSEANHDDELSRPAESLCERRADIEERMVELRTRAVVAMEWAPQGSSRKRVVNALFSPSAPETT